MNKVSFVVVWLGVCVSGIGASPRLLWHTAPAYWSEGLSDARHPSFPADVGMVQEGRLSLGFGLSEKDLDHLSLTLPGFQIVSANTHLPRMDNSGVLRWIPNEAALFYDTTGMSLALYRAFFSITGGVAWSTFRTESTLWDAGIGLTYENNALWDEWERRELWAQRLLLGGITVRYGSWNLAGAWSPAEFRYRFTYRVPEDWQAGLVIYQNPRIHRGFGAAICGEKTFHQSIRIYGKVENQWVEQSRIKQIMAIGVFLRFRPWRSGTDPVWLAPWISPANGSRYFYDWELGLELSSDQETQKSKSSVSLSRWF